MFEKISVSIILITLFSLNSYSAKLDLNKCIEGDCENGFGTYIYPDGTKYVGEWRNNQRNGKGILILQKKVSGFKELAGKWINDKYLGEINYEYNNGKLIPKFTDKNPSNNEKFIEKEFRKYIKETIKQIEQKLDYNNDKTINGFDWIKMNHNEKLATTQTYYLSLLQKWNPITPKFINLKEKVNKNLNALNNYYSNKENLKLNISSSLEKINTK